MVFMTVGGIKIVKTGGESIKLSTNLEVSANLTVHHINNIDIQKMKNDLEDEILKLKSDLADSIVYYERYSRERPIAINYWESSGANFGLHIICNAGRGFDVCYTGGSFYEGSYLLSGGGKTKLYRENLMTTVGAGPLYEHRPPLCAGTYNSPVWDNYGEPSPLYEEWYDMYGYICWDSYNWIYYTVPDNQKCTDIYQYGHAIAHMRYTQWPDSANWKVGRIHSFIQDTVGSNVIVNGGQRRLFVVHANSCNFVEIYGDAEEV